MTFRAAGWSVGGTYLYANPIDGPCVVPANHAKGAVCVSRSPAQHQSDDTLPGFTLSTFDEAYLELQSLRVRTGRWATARSTRRGPIRRIRG